MRLRLLPVAVLAAVLAGCGDSSLPMATTPEKARAALDTAFTAWKAGKTQADLKNQSPPIYFNDDDLVRGRKLVDYKVEGDGVPFGTGIRYDVSLTLQDGTKPPVTRKFPYRVVTDPNISVARDDK